MLTASRRRALLAFAIALASVACLLPSASAGGSPTGYYAEVTADNPVALWKLDEGSDYTAVDATGHGHNGVYYPANTGYSLRGATTPMGTPAVVFNFMGWGSPLLQQVDIPWFQDLNPVDNTYTLEAWVNPSWLPVTGYGDPSNRFASILCSRDDDPPMGGYHLYIGYYESSPGAGDARPRFSFLGGTGAGYEGGSWGTYRYVVDQSENVLQTGQWYHVVATLDAQQHLSLYVNGSPVSGPQKVVGPDTAPIIPNCEDRATIGACSARSTLPDHGEGARISTSRTSSAGSQTSRSMASR